MIVRRSLVCVSLAVTTVLSTAGIAAADDGGQVTTSPDSAKKVEQALSAVAPDVLAQSATTGVSTDSDSSLVSQQASGSVDAPKDPGSAPVSVVTANGLSVQVGIPGAAQAADAATVQPGVAAYSGIAPDASLVVQATKDEGTRFLTIINGADAPSDYRFAITPPSGTHMTLDSDGGITFVDNSNDSGVSGIAPPWAKDANSNPLPASYRLDGDTVELHVDHAGAAYPVVADPWLSGHCGWSRCSFVYSRSMTQNLRNHATLITGAGGLAALACGAAGPFAIPCRIAVVVYFAWTIDTLNNAARQNQCLGFGHEYWMLLSAVWYPYIDRGGWCNNN